MEFLTSYVCYSLTNESVTFKWVHWGTKSLTLPDCYWDYASQFTTIDIWAETEGGVVIRGPSVGESDPLLALGTNVTSLKLVRVKLEDPVSGNGGSNSNGGFFVADIGAFLEQNNATLTTLVMNGCRLRGSLPSVFPPLPVLSMFSLESNQLSGSLPQTLPSQVTSFSLHQNNFTGALPAQIPRRMQFLILSNNALSGQIPSAFFSRLAPASYSTVNLASNALSGTLPSTLLSDLPPLNALFLDLSSNEFIGTIPSDLFGSSASLRDFASFGLTLDGNRLEGTIPAELFAHFFSSSQFELSLDNNNLSGSLTNSDLFSNMTANRLSSFTLSMSGNSFTGSIPQYLNQMTHLSALTQISLDLSANRLSGPLPSKILPSGSSSLTQLRSLVLNLDSNVLTGTIPATLLNSEPNVPELVLTIGLSSNTLSGTIPSTLVGSNIAGTNKQINLNFASNNLVGPLASIGTLDGVTSLSLDLSRNNLGSTIPNGYFTTITNAAGTPRRASLTMVGCKLRGPIPTIPYGIDVRLDDNALTAYAISETFATDLGFNRALNVISIQRNRLAGTINLPGAASGGLALYLNNNLLSKVNFTGHMDYLHQLDVSDNPNLIGTLSAEFFTNASLIQYLAARNTKVSGKFPRISYALNSGLYHLDLSNSRIDFCSLSRPAWSSQNLKACDLRGTNATQCTNMYPDLCLSGAANNPATSPGSTPPSGSPGSPLGSGPPNSQPNVGPTGAAATTTVSSTLMVLSLTALLNLL